VIASGRVTMTPLEEAIMSGAASIRSIAKLIESEPERMGSGPLASVRNEPPAPIA
jgi:hypothetical protein